MKAVMSAAQTIALGQVLNTSGGVVIAHVYVSDAKFLIA
jgi:hypothetical protein